MEIKLRALSSVYPKMLFKQIIVMSIETMLVDGRILAFECKGEHLYDGEGDKGSFAGRDEMTL